MEWLERLRDFKNETNETYKTIADKTDIPQTTVEKIFCGRTKDPKLNMMKKIVHCLNHTLDDLVEEPKNNHINANDDIIEKLNQLDIKDRAEICGIIKGMLYSDKYKKTNNIADDINNIMKAAENLGIKQK